MTYEIEVPDTPQEAVELHLQESFDDARRAVEKMQEDRFEIAENAPKPIDCQYVLSILRLAISLSELLMVNMDRDALRPDQRDHAAGILAKRARKRYRE